MASLQQLLDQHQVWRARHGLASSSDSVPSGYAELDALLPGGGLPRAALTEILYDQPGIGELRLLAPLLARLGQEQRWQLWVTPPWPPYAPALAQAGIALEQQVLVRHASPADSLWAFEQGLRSGACSLVLGWLPRLNTSELRRLQLAAASGDCLGILFRASHQASQSSPAALRILLEVRQQQIGLALLKRRGGWPLPWQTIDLGEASPVLPPLETAS